jgi:hypothetical protein
MSSFFILSIACVTRPALTGSGSPINSARIVGTTCQVSTAIVDILLAKIVYDPHHFLLTSVDLPTFVQVIKASPEKPYLGLVLNIDQREISQLMVDSNLPPPRPQQSSRGMAIGEVTEPLLAAFQRLIDLLDEPKDIPILAPVIEREIFYRLLVGDQGARLRQIASSGSQSHQIARAIDWLKKNFTRPLRIEISQARSI